MPYKKIITRFFLFPLGIALFTAVIIFQEGTAISVDLLVTPEATLSPFERLAKPTLPPVPLQADRGAQTFWLWCLPCHGERGQGLTDEFRETYPPDHQFCWERGCHGKRPYENGFSIPTWIPAVIGSEAEISKFQTAASLFAYIRFVMPYWNPGALTDEEAWDVTAFLLRENDLWDGVDELNNSNAGQVFLSDQVPTSSILPTLTPTPTQITSPGEAEQEQPFAWEITLIVLVVIVVTLLLVSRWISSTGSENE